MAVAEVEQADRAVGQVGGPAVRPTIIVSSPAPILAFDSNEHYLAWWRDSTGSSAHPICGIIRRRSWQSGASVALDPCTFIDVGSEGLALAGANAYWLWSLPARS